MNELPKNGALADLQTPKHGALAGLQKPKTARAHAKMSMAGRRREVKRIEKELEEMRANFEWYIK